MITLQTFERTPSLAELKVSYRRGRPKTDKQERMPFFVSSPVSCEKYLRSVWDDDTIELREEFVLLCEATTEYRLLMQAMERGENGLRIRRVEIPAFGGLGHGLAPFG